MPPQSDNELNINENKMANMSSPLKETHVNRKSILKNNTTQDKTNKIINNDSSASFSLESDKSKSRKRKVTSQSQPIDSLIIQSINNENLADSNVQDGTVSQNKLKENEEIINNTNTFSERSSKKRRLDSPIPPSTFPPHHHPTSNTNTNFSIFSIGNNFKPITPNKARRITRGPAELGPELDLYLSNSAKKKQQEEAAAAVASKIQVSPKKIKTLTIKPCISNSPKKESFQNSTKRSRRNSLAVEPPWPTFDTNQKSSASTFSSKKSNNERVKESQSVATPKIIKSLPIKAYENTSTTLKAHMRTKSPLKAVDTKPELGNYQINLFCLSFLLF